MTQPSAKEATVQVNQQGWEFMGLPETLKGVRLGGCRFTARGGGKVRTPILASVHEVSCARCRGPPPPAIQP